MQAPEFERYSVVQHDGVLQNGSLFEHLIADVDWRLLPTQLLVENTHVDNPVLESFLEAEILRNEPAITPGEGEEIVVLLHEIWDCLVGVALWALASKGASGLMWS